MDRSQHTSFKDVGRGGVGQLPPSLHSSQRGRGVKVVLSNLLFSLKSTWFVYLLSITVIHSYAPAKPSQLSPAPLPPATMHHKDHPDPSSGRLFPDEQLTFCLPFIKKG